MEYDTSTYFTENEADDVKGFTIIGRNQNSGEYHIAEKWSREDTEDKWLQYWIPEAQLLARVENDKCEERATLTQEQLEKVCSMIDHDGVVAAPA
jgi:hypothetical protein